MNPVPPQQTGTANPFDALVPLSPSLDRIFCSNGTRLTLPSSLSATMGRSRSRCVIILSPLWNSPSPFRLSTRMTIPSSYPSNLGTVPSPYSSSPNTRPHSPQPLPTTSLFLLRPSARAWFSSRIISGSCCLVSIFCLPLCASSTY